MRQSDPRRSRAVIIGVSEYAELEDLPSVLPTAHDFADLLTDRELWGLRYPKHCAFLLNPAHPQDVLSAVHAAADAAEETLLVYFAGHGLVSGSTAKDKELHLALTDSTNEKLYTAIPYRQVRELVQRCAARNKVVILDCCYSGLASGTMGETEEDIADLAKVKGTCVMSACPETRRALAPNGERYTAFTGELIRAIRDGIPNDAPTLNMESLYGHVKERLENQKRPVPQLRMTDKGSQIALVHNRGGASPSAQGDEPPSSVPTGPRTPPVGGRRSTRLYAAAAVAALAALAAGVAAAPAAAHVWHWINPRDAGGRCSDRATLLSHSDDLDKKQVSEEKLEGLSALSLTGGTEAVALTDNAAARLFPLRLGPPTALKPRARRATTLRTPGGVDRSKWFDGEGLVVEKSGRTALVASETGPSIQRYRMSDGEPVGEPLPVPRQFRIREKGEAQAGRTLESLAASADGRYLYAAMEGPLAVDGDVRGRNLLRIQRYRGEPGGDYELDRQYAYRTGEGTYLSEIATAGEDRLLTVERQYVLGMGSSIRVYEVPLDGAVDVREKTALYDQHANTFVRSLPLFDLARCPQGTPGAVANDDRTQSNRLLQNVEGMALGPRWTEGPHKGRRPLYLISDDNGSDEQITRLYALSVRLRGDG